WKRYELEVVHGTERLGPERGLDAEDRALGHAIEPGGRLPVVGVAHVDDPGPAQADRRRRVVLHVQVDAARGREDDTRAARDREVYGVPPPVLHDRVQREPCRRDLTPADHALAVR